ncbi:MAG: DegV family protein [Lachnospiraceae bacterium]|nr:DegV family protein [Lachnospiraceae bacterium]
MRTFEIFTDSSCDLPQEYVQQFNLHVMQLEVIVDDQPPVLNRDIEVKKCYDLLRNGANIKTSAVTLGHFEEHMRACLQEGKDILYVGFSSGLSATYNNGVMVINELKDEFPERKILHTDTFAATGGQGLLVYYAAQLREEGCSMEEIIEKVDAVKDHIHHQITVENLFFLKRGGRISATTAIAGSVLQIKPIIIMDMAGKLQSVGKVRGRKASITELFNKMKATADLEEFGYVGISHSDCIEEAKALAELVEQEFHPKKIIFGDIGPVIGAHTGPGAMALTYYGRDLKGI